MVPGSSMGTIHGLSGVHSDGQALPSPKSQLVDRSTQLSQGMPYRRPPHEVTIMADASMEGRGGHSTIAGRKLLSGGDWSQKESQSHIFLFKLRTLRLTLLSFSSTYRDSRFYSNETTSTVYYVDEQGGARSLALNQGAEALHQGCNPSGTRLSGGPAVLPDRTQLGGPGVVHRLWAEAVLGDCVS